MADVEHLPPAVFLLRVVVSVRVAGDHQCHPANSEHNPGQFEGRQRLSQEHPAQGGAEDGGQRHQQHGEAGADHDEGLKEKGIPDHEPDQAGEGQPAPAERLGVEGEELSLRHPVHQGDEHERQ